jgi:hypothetical protein
MVIRKRRVITRSGARVRGYFFSLKSKALIPGESQLEFRACTLAEFDRSINALKAHQQQTTVQSSEQAFDTYPDFSFAMKDGSNKIIEVKSDRELKDEQVIERLAQIKEHFGALGTDYEVWSETFIDQEPRKSTLDDLLFYRRPSTRSSLLKRRDYLDLKSRHTAVSFRKASECLGGHLEVHKFLANDLLAADLTVPLTDETSVTIH